MFKVVTALLLISWAESFPVTQEELAQYVARQQTAGAVPRRQAYILQPQPKQQVYQVQPTEQPQYYQAAQQPQQYYQAQPQQLRYPQAQTLKKIAPRPIGPKGEQLEDPEDYDPNPHYQFGFDIKDDEFTNYQKRKEQREGDKISGSYSVVDSDGYIRTVTYTADPLEGFKADVVREPTDIKVKIPQPPQLLPQQYQQYAPQQNLVARKQQTQQYLQASAPVQAKPQYVVRPEHTQVYTSAQAPQLRQLAHFSPSADKQSKAAAIGYAQQPQASPVLYQAYQQ